MVTPLAPFASTDVAGVSTVLLASSDSSGDPQTELDGNVMDAACVTDARLFDDPRRDIFCRFFPLPLAVGAAAGGSGDVDVGRSLVHSVCGSSTSGASGGSGLDWNGGLGLSGAGGSRPRALRLAAPAIETAVRGTVGPAVSEGVSSGSTDSVAVDGATEGALTAGLRIVMIDDAGGRTGNEGCAGARKP